MPDSSMVDGPSASPTRMVTVGEWASYEQGRRGRRGRRIAIAGTVLRSEDPGRHSIGFKGSVPEADPAKEMRRRAAAAS